MLTYSYHLHFIVFLTKLESNSYSLHSDRLETEIMFLCCPVTILFYGPHRKGVSYSIFDDFVRLYPFCTIFSEHLNFVFCVSRDLILIYSRIHCDYGIQHQLPFILYDLKGCLTAWKRVRAFS
jgi:hypothetical protein